jgi:hypothetical protein
MKDVELRELNALLKYSYKYEISLQFWPEEHIAVFIAKHGVDLTSYGGKYAIINALEYLNRINQKQ